MLGLIAGLSQWHKSYEIYELLWFPLLTLKKLALTFHCTELGQKFILYWIDVFPDRLHKLMAFLPRQYCHCPIPIVVLIYNIVLQRFCPSLNQCYRRNCLLSRHPSRSAIEDLKLVPRNVPIMNLEKILILSILGQVEAVNFFINSGAFFINERLCGVTNLRDILSQCWSPLYFQG